MSAPKPTARRAGLVAPLMAVGLAVALAPDPGREAAELLDRNGDGTLERFEAAAAALAWVDRVSGGAGEADLDDFEGTAPVRGPGPEGSAPASIRREGDALVIEGALGPDAPGDFLRGLMEGPGLREVRFGRVSGDGAAHELARLITLSKLPTRLNRDSAILGSGPLATAGVRRFVDPGATVFAGPERGARLRGSALDALRTEPVGLELGSIGRDASLRGLCAVDVDVAWATGSGATVALTVDGGRTWRQVAPASIEGLDVRDVHALDARTAWIMTAGPGEASRILRTDDGGGTWTEQHRETDPASFLDGFAFWSAERAIAYGDPLPGVGFRVLVTEDGGATWTAMPTGPSPMEGGEASFAASGTGVRTDGTTRAWIVTGANGAGARVFRSDDGGASWEAFTSTLAAGKPAAGAFSLAMRADGRGVLVGGDYLARSRSGTGNAAWTEDFGATWTAPTAGPRGQRAGSAVLGNGHFLCTGQTGTDISTDGGRTWRAFSDEGFHCVDVSTVDGTIWFAGPKGRVGRLR